MKGKISLYNGNGFETAREAWPEIEARNLWGAVVNMMDDELREKVNAEKAPCTDLEFLEAYLDAHFAQFGEHLVIG